MRFAAQVIAEAIGFSLRVLVNVFNLFLIGFVIFALAGVSLYKNSLKRQCVLPSGVWLPPLTITTSEHRTPERFICIAAPIVLG